MRIVLAGNPNSGKTTLYNAITGKLEYVGNWSGVTVDVKEIKVKKKYGDDTVVDLPGAYSISPYSEDEVVTAEFINHAKADVIINIIDITNLSRSLFFTTQLLELGIPIVIALNKTDILMDKIDYDKLSKELDCPVVEISAEKNKNIKKLIDATKYAKASKYPLALNSDKDRFKYIDNILDKIYIEKADRTKKTTSDKIDAVLTSKILGLPIFFFVLWGVYYLSQNLIGGYFSSLLGEEVFGKIVPDFLNSWFVSMNIDPFLQSLIVDGAIAGVGAVLSFLPLIMVLFFCLALLEDCGYMARVAVVMDFFFKKIGLSGKAIIPIVVGTGCSIPGIMATRTIEDENERRRMCILTPFIPCGAKLPVIGLFSAAFFPNITWLAPAMTLFAIGLVFIVGYILKKIFTSKNALSIFMIELPHYKIPRVSYAFRNMIDKAWEFIKKAGTIILICNTVVVLLQNYNFALSPVTSAHDSILATIAGVLTPIFIPLGFASWQFVASSITGFIAKENIVGTLATIFVVTQGTLESAEGPLHTVGGLTNITALAFLAFNLFSPPCFAAIGAMNAEMKSKKWLLRGILIQFGTGYTLALLINQLGTLIYTGKLAQGFIPAIVVLLTFAVIVIIFIKNPRKSSLRR